MRSVSWQSKETSYCFPLYLYRDDTQTKNGGNGDLFSEGLNYSPHSEGCQAKPDEVVNKTDGKTPSRLSAYSPLAGGELERKRQPNFDPKILQKFVSELGLRFVSDHEGDEDINSPPAKEGWQAKPAGVVNKTDGKTPSRLSAYSPLAGGELERKRQPNFDPKILQKIVDGLGLRFVNDHERDKWGNGEALKNGRKSVIANERIECGNLESNKQDEIATSCLRTPRNDENMLKPTLTPLDILDYIYAVLHSPNYRETYKEFLKIDFPKIPYPTDRQKFWQLVTLGREIRLYHLLEHPNLATLDTNFPQGGNNKITTKISTKDFIVKTAKTHGKIMINDTQFFDNIPVRHGIFISADTNLHKNG